MVSGSCLLTKRFVWKFTLQHSSFALSGVPNGQLSIKIYWRKYLLLKSKPIEFEIWLELQPTEAQLSCWSTNPTWKQSEFQYGFHFCFTKAINSSWYFPPHHTRVAPVGIGLSSVGSVQRIIANSADAAGWGRRGGWRCKYIWLGNVQQVRLWQLSLITSGAERFSSDKLMRGDFTSEPNKFQILHQWKWLN